MTFHPFPWLRAKSVPQMAADRLLDARRRLLDVEGSLEEAVATRDLLIERIARLESYAVEGASAEVTFLNFGGTDE